ncbi:MAG: hypothetical protein ACYC97_08820, partial [Metallibacterium sp.]
MRKDAPPRNFGYRLPASLRHFRASAWSESLIPFLTQPVSMHLPYFDAFDAIAFHIGPIPVHWYGLMYLGGFIAA